ncbi:MAG: PDZ domain-containing protein [Sulfurimonas sp.]|uniref:DUF7488 domain-containing protein n=1 Tax=Sulfurimonas sp. TaxID=2022749 RepID=UPI0026384629|nr:PDZ domain-containing protein [Sulfurimonas sp.]MDD5373891.1 PDZ domain-containing protein [Sulfurimonas sp.]
MFRLFLALNFLFFNLYACEGDFDSCRLKVVDSEAIVNQTLQIPIGNNQRLIFSKTAPNVKIIKHDPYLSLYLVEDTKKFKYPFKINMNIGTGLFGVDNNKIIKGKIVKQQIGLESFAAFSEQLPTPSLLLNSCCSLEGIVTERGIIEKEYIERFLKSKSVSYADFGIKVNDVGSAVVVSSSNSILKNNLFKKDDIILEFDGKKVKNSAALMREMLFSQIGSTHSIKIKRGSEVSVISATSQDKKGGGLLNDTFLEFLGLSFDKNLVIKKIEKNAEQYGLKIGDKLLQIDTKSVKNEQDIFDIMSDSKKSANLLFQREQFQFFVKLN